jgi:very-short-patch-repair endonuclease
VIEEYQAAAYESMRWFENARQYMHLSPLELAYSLMMRSRRVNADTLRQRDPAFMKAYDEARANCFRGNAKIHTESGWRSIDSIRAGDRVWTHRGRLRHVVGVQRRPHVGRLLGVSLENSESVVWCTPEQRFLVSYSPSPQAERGRGGEEGDGTHPTPNPSPLAGRGTRAEIHRTLGGSNAALLPLSRQLRVDATSAEVVLWERLRGRRLLGAKFRRQHPLGAHYIVDFYCAQSRLAVELDGSVHDSPKAGWSDGIRHRQIQQAGVRVLRFQNEQIFDDLESVLAEIAQCLTAAPQADSGGNDIWVRAEILEAGFQLLLNERGEQTVVAIVDSCFANETVFDLTVEEDHSFVTEAGVAHNRSRCDSLK